MVQIKKRKKYKVNAKFYVWIICFGMFGSLFSQLYHNVQSNVLPNFHGWTAKDLMRYDEQHENIKIKFELVYSYDVLHNRVLSQSVKPKTRLTEDQIELTVQVSKGYPIMIDFTGQDVEKILTFAKLYDIKVTQSAARSLLTTEPTLENTNKIVINQSIVMGETLTKGAEVEIVLGENEMNE
ncbi:MAG: PASTA domain-containing protein [Turicibacter sp.]